MSLFLESGDDVQEFLVVDFVVNLNFIEFARVESYWVYFFVNYLGEDTVKGIVAGVCLDDSLVFWCEMTKDWSCRKECFEYHKCLLLFGSPVKILRVVFELISNQFANCREILNEPMIKVGKVYKDLNVFNISSGFLIEDRLYFTY